MNYPDNPQLQMAYNFLELTNQNVFLTGKAGTGKTTFLQNLKRSSPKRMVVLAPTGVAAINAGGATIHSFFQMPFGPHIPELTLVQDEKTGDRAIFKLNKMKIDIIRTLDLLVIDEISMVRADLLDGIDEVLRRYRNTTRPFGGVQLLMIGDLQQLAPVVKDDEWNILKSYYETAFFFSSRALRKTSYITVELTHIYRQSDRFFIDILNQIRNNKVSQETFIDLNKRYIPSFTPNEKDGYITLTTHNYQANELNQFRLEQIDAKAFTPTAIIEGNFPVHAYPTEMELELKKGAQVMFVKNDPSPEKLYYNGKIGKIIHIDDEIVYVKCPGDSDEISVGRAEWQNTSYTIDNETKEIKETIEGTFVQYPLKLAWAITIHKSQGLTFEKVVIDAAQAFSHGQVYVALSRCKTLDGIVLSSRIDRSCLRSNSTVNDFNEQIELNPVTDQQLKSAQNRYEIELLHELFDFENIQNRLQGCLKLLSQYKPFLLGQPDEEIKQVIAKSKEEILTVADKFRNQVSQLSIQGACNENTALQERISRACPYFVEKLVNLIGEPVEKLVIETDNKEIRKETDETIEKVLNLVMQKKMCLEATVNGFDVKNYLTVRAKSLLIKQGKKPKSEKTEKFVEDLGVKHARLFNQLKAWRHQEAEEMNIPAYFVLAQKPLVEIVNRLPETIDELSKIKGMGKSKTKQYGNQIIEIVRNYKQSNNLQVKQQTIEIPKKETETKTPKKESEAKIPNHKITFLFYQQTGSIDEVIKARSLSRATVIKHLGMYVQSGEIDIYQLVDHKKVERIIMYFEQAESPQLKPAKEALGDEISYDDLNLVLSYLKQNAL